MNKKTIDGYRREIKLITSGHFVTKTVDVDVNDLTEMLDKVEDTKKEEITSVVTFMVGVFLGYWLTVAVLIF